MENLQGIYVEINALNEIHSNYLYKYILKGHLLRYYNTSALCVLFFTHIGIYFLPK